MLTKHQKVLKQQWALGRLNIIRTAKRMGYKGASLTKGIAKVKTMLLDMGITLL